MKGDCSPQGRAPINRLSSLPLSEFPPAGTPDELAGVDARATLSTALPSNPARLIGAGNP